MNKLILFLIAIVLVGIAGFALLWFGIGRELQPAAAKVLIDCRDGKYVEVYEAADPRLRATQTPEQFQAYWEHWKGELGEFLEILKRTGVGTQTGTDGTTKFLTLELGFRKGKAFGHFKFAGGEEGPLLKHMWIGKPVAVASRKDRSGLEADARELLVRWDASDSMGLYAGLSAELQIEWTLKKLTEELGRLRPALGSVRAARLVGTEETDEDTVTQRFEVEFENDTRKLKVSHRWLRARWQVVAFVVEAKG